MNVAILTDNDFANVNGVTTSLKAAVRYAPEGVHAKVYTASDLAEDRDDYFAAAAPSVRMPFYGEMRMYFPRFRRLLDTIRRDRVDVLHLTTPGPIGLAGLYIAWRTGLRMIGSFHTDLAAYTERLSGSRLLGRLMREYLRWPYGKCEQIFVPSESTRRLLIAGKINPAKIALWTRGVDAALFSPAKRSPILRDGWRVCDRRPSIVYVGRLSREKGLAQLPAVVAALHRRGAEHRLVLVGDGPLRRELQAALPDAIFTGTLTPPEVAVALASADLFLFPSETDSAGNVVLEAQACGLPVIVADAGGPSEYVRAGETGIVCRAGDTEAFGHEAADLLRHRRRRETMGIAARAHAETLRWESALAPLYRAYVEAASVVPHGPTPRREEPSRAATGATA